MENDKREPAEPDGMETFPSGVVRDFLAGNTDADSAALVLKEKVRKIYKITGNTEKTKELIALANEIEEELSSREVLRARLWHTPAKCIAQLNEEKDKYYYLSTTVNDDEIIVDWNAWNGQPFRDVYRKVDGMKEIPDKELLHENPVEWFAKFLNSGMYRKQNAK